MTTETSAARGGSFLTEAATPDEIFTPEDFNDEALLLAQTTRDFIENEVVPVIDRLEKKEDGLMLSLLKKAGEIGTLARRSSAFRSICEEYGEAVRAAAYWSEMERRDYGKAEEFRQIANELEQEAFTELMQHKVS